MPICIDCTRNLSGVLAGVDISKKKEKKRKGKTIKRAITHAIWANMLANIFGLTSMFINTQLGALCVADEGMRNEGAGTALSQLLGFMFSQHTHGSCLTSDAPKGSLRGTSLVSLLELD